MSVTSFGLVHPPDQISVSFVTKVPSISMSQTRSPDLNRFFPDASSSLMILNDLSMAIHPQGAKDLSKCLFDDLNQPSISSHGEGESAKPLSSSKES